MLYAELFRYVPFIIRAKIGKCELIHFISYYLVLQITKFMRYFGQ
jgi:hypothetical protein